MNALTIGQPYAHLIATGQKPIENRTWFTNHRGLLAIHAGKSRDWLDSGEDDVSMMAFGAIVAVARIVACLPKPDRVIPSWGRWTHLIDHEHANGPWCWVLENVRRLNTPIACRGAQGLWTVPTDVEQQVTDALRRQAA
jgi:hypothetical protein